jgi:hypothetical protein
VKFFPQLIMPALSTVQRQNLVIICGGLSGIMATSWYFIHWSQQEDNLEAERLARQHPYRYRPPLHALDGPEFSLDDLNETYCIEFFR